MKMVFLFFAFLIFETAPICAQEQLEIDNPEYDSVLAKELGADDYGMKKYVMAFLKKGPKRSEDKEERAKLQRAHLDNITKLADEGKLVLAGPFFGEGEIRGIYIFDVQSIQEAKELTSTDPAIRAGSLVMYLKEWYGSAALLKLKDIYPKISKKKI
ncbi:MAG: YciI family protein [Cytophagales bacterium]